MANNSILDSFLESLGRFPLLTPEQEITYGRHVKQAIALEQLTRSLTKAEQRIIKRGKRARQKFFECNLRLVVYIAKRYMRQTQFMDVNDLVQEGALGLMRAIDKYDPERGYKFSTYAYWWIRQGINRSIQSTEKLIRRPSKVLDIASKIPRSMHEYSVKFGRLPSTGELAAFMQISEEELIMIKGRGATVVSLDAIVLSTEHAVLLDLVADPNSVDAYALDDQLDTDLWLPQLLDLLDGLPDTTRNCIERRFGLNGHDPHTYAEIGKQMNVSRERVRQIVSKGLNVIRVKASKLSIIGGLRSVRSAA